MRRAVAPAVSLLLGGLGGWGAALIGMPLPWLLGAMLVNAVWVQAWPPREPGSVSLPRPVQIAVIAFIGLVIGGMFTPELAAAALGWWPSLIAVLLFTLIGQFGAFLIYHRLFGYDVPTAYFAASPGGFIENIALGTAAGGDHLSLTLLQFLRLVSVLFLVPLGIAIWAGRNVGSAAGESLAVHNAAAGWAEYGFMLAALLLGYRLGHMLRVPAADIIGPLIAGRSCI